MSLAVLSTIAIFIPLMNLAIYYIPYHGPVCDLCIDQLHSFPKTGWFVAQYTGSYWIFIFPTIAAVLTQLAYLTGKGWFAGIMAILALAAAIFALVSFHQFTMTYLTLAYPWPHHRLLGSTLPYIGEGVLALINLAMLGAIMRGMLPGASAQETLEASPAA